MIFTVVERLSAQIAAQQRTFKRASGSYLTNIELTLTLKQLTLNKGLKYKCECSICEYLTSGIDMLPNRTPILTGSMYRYSICTLHHFKIY